MLVRQRMDKYHMHSTPYYVYLFFLVSNILVTASHLELIFYYLRSMPLTDLVRFMFKFVLLSHTLVGYTNIYLYDRLNLYHFMHTFVHFTIVVLTWYDFTS